jgi:1,4-alpha-glucan branching enzyme
VRAGTAWRPFIFVAFARFAVLKPFQVVVASAAVSASCAAAIVPAPPAVTPAGVRFRLTDPEADSVTLAGSFNQWSTSSHPLARERSSGVWSVVVTLPPGEHLFMYFVNGTRWVSPPRAEDYSDDGFGSKNGVVFVRPAEQ